jgi:hypothetical protein
MRFYNRQHTYYCGIDLHGKTMYVCILDGAGQVLVHRKVPSTPTAFLEIVKPYREDLVVAAECMFTWYWLADVCAAEAITFVLGHALAMKAIHGGKAKHDKIDSHKIAVLLRGGLLPQAYVYPSAMRSTRDLLRRRLHLVRKRGELLAHIQNTRAQYNLPAFEKRLAYPGNRDGVVEHFPDPSVRKSIEVDVALIEVREPCGCDVLDHRHTRRQYRGPAEHEPPAGSHCATVENSGLRDVFRGAELDTRVDTTQLVWRKDRVRNVGVFHQLPLCHDLARRQCEPTD